MANHTADEKADSRGKRFEVYAWLVMLFLWITAVCAIISTFILIRAAIMVSQLGDALAELGKTLGS